MQIRFAIAFALTLLGTPASGIADESETQFFVPIPKGWSVAFDGSTEDARTIEFVPNGQTIHDWSEMIAIYVIDRRALDNTNLYFANTIIGWGKICREYGYGVLGAAIETEDGMLVPDPSLTSAWFIAYCTWTDHQYTEQQKPGPFGQISTYYAIASDDYLFVAQRSWRTAPLETEVPVDQETLNYENARMAASVLCENEPDTEDCADRAANQLQTFTDLGDTIFQVGGGLGL